MEEIS